MIKLTGEYEVKLDERGRLKLPQKLLDSLGEQKSKGFIVNRGFENHLTIYPKDVWEEKTTEIDRLNLYDNQHREAIRYFYRGATELLLDSSDRINIPSSLLEHAGITKEAFLFAYMGFIEIWSKEAYKELIAKEPNNFAAIINNVMGSKPNIQHSI